MRTIVFDEPFSVTVRLEGDLTAEAAAQLSTRVAAWRDLSRARRVRFDLGDIAAVDREGTDFLRGLSRLGFEFAVMSPALRELENELRPNGKENLRDWLARIGIRISPSSEKPQSLFRRLLCAVLPPGVAGCPCER